MIDQNGLEEAIRRAVDPLTLMQRVADEAINLVKNADGVLVGLAQDSTWLSFACAVVPFLPTQAAEHL